MILDLVNDVAFLLRSILGLAWFCRDCSLDISFDIAKSVTVHTVTTKKEYLSFLLSAESSKKEKMHNLKKFLCDPCTSTRVFFVLFCFPGGWRRAQWQKRTLSEAPSSGKAKEKDARRSKFFFWSSPRGCHTERHPSELLFLRHWVVVV